MAVSENARILMSEMQGSRHFQFDARSFEVKAQSFDTAQYFAEKEEDLKKLAETALSLEIYHETCRNAVISLGSEKNVP